MSHKLARHFMSRPQAKTAIKAAVFAALMSLGACGGGQAVREQTEAERVEEANLKRTMLDAHVPTAIPVEARLSLSAPGNATGVAAQEVADLRTFGQDFVRLGRGNVVISVPNNASNSQSAAFVAQDVQRILFLAGVDYTRMVSGPYQASGSGDAPVLVSYGRYEAKASTCTPWSQVDPRKTASNLPPDRFGCAQNANLAAMIADPGDFLGDRRDTVRDAARLQNGIEQHRKGAVPTVSGAVATGGGGGQ